jgi:tetratricopeptide (TPR) repeat protein
VISGRAPIFAIALLLAAACAQSAQRKATADMDVIRMETTPRSLQERGESAAMVGDLTRAEQYFVAALRAGGDERVLTKRLFVVCVADGRFPAAASYGEDYLRNHPRDTDLRYALATVYIALGDVPVARSTLEQVVEERPELADAHYALATILRQQGDALLDADHHLREYLRLDPNGKYVEAARASLLKSVR